MSLSNDAVLNVLKNQFVCGFKNITGEAYAGKSGHHDTDAPAVVTTNGAGPHNVQMFILNTDGIVLHCLPGYWAPHDLLFEMRFAAGLDRLWRNPGLDDAAKRDLFKKANLTVIRQAPKDMLERSHLQSFDAKHDNLKTTDQVVHERMAQRPFLTYEDFDVESFSNYGKNRYDKKEETREGGTKKK